MGEVKRLRIGRVNVTWLFNTRPWQLESWFTPSSFDKMYSLFSSVGPFVFEITIWRSPK